MADTPGEATHVLATLVSGETDEQAGPALDLPLDASAAQLQSILQHLLEEGDDPRPYSFFVNEVEVTTTVRDVVNAESVSLEKTLRIVYHPQAVFRVRSVTRCTSSLPGHTDSILAVSFSPDGRLLATGGGDTTVRFWDVQTQLPLRTCKGHKTWVLSLAWSPDGERLASGDNNGRIMVWSPHSGAQMGRTMEGHRKWVTALSWEPFHRNISCQRLASSSKDATMRVWDTATGSCQFTVGGHIMSVTCVRWGGEGLIYTGSQDRTIKVWSDTDGRLVRTLAGHAHWVNTMAISTDVCLRTGAHEQSAPEHGYDSRDDAFAAAKKRYETLRRMGTPRQVPELLVSGSDDFTMYVWDPMSSKRPLKRLTGHQGLVNQVAFSPDMRYFASASFDKSVKLWDGKTGKFIATLRGHVGAVYQVAWAADSRLLVSGSKDSTLKVWDLKTRKLKEDLPGHADEVYSVDWSPDGLRVASGAKDRVVKIWQH